MAAKYEDSRFYKASRGCIFQACCDAMQPCGFSVTSLDSNAFTIHATVQFTPTRDAGVVEEVMWHTFKGVLAKRFGEDISISVDDAGCVHVLSKSRPRTTLLDQGRNKENVLNVWGKLDGYLLGSSGVVVHDNSVNIGENNGIVQSGGLVNARQVNNFGEPTLNASSSRSEHERRGNSSRWDVGVITILSEETHAVLRVLGLRRKQVDGLRFYEGETNLDGIPMRVVAIQALTQGQRSTMAAYGNLRRYYDPKVVVLVGIGGGIRADVAVGEVVVADRIVYYDLRKETPAGTQRRGEEREAPAEIGHAINAFFADHEPAEFSVKDSMGTTRVMRMRSGLIGSGDAVIADHDADALKYLAGFNDKVLAVDMEAGGLSAACYEESAASGKLHGWVVLRGISDDAGAGKNDEYHYFASWHVAMALRELLPYLRVSTSPTPTT